MFPEDENRPALYLRRVSSTSSTETLFNSVYKYNKVNIFNE